LKVDLIRVPNNDKFADIATAWMTNRNLVMLVYSDLIASFASHISRVVIRHYLTFLRLLSGTLRMIHVVFRCESQKKLNDTLVCVTTFVRLY